MTKKMLMLILTCSVVTVYAFREMKPMTDSEIRGNILSGALKAYEGECPCPFSKDKKGNLCGDDSEYFRSRGRVLCYERDVSDAEVNAYRQKYGITDPNADPHGRLDFGIKTEESNTQNPTASPETSGLEKQSPTSP